MTFLDLHDHKGSLTFGQVRETIEYWCHRSAHFWSCGLPLEGCHSLTFGLPTQAEAEPMRESSRSCAFPRACAEWGRLVYAGHPKKAQACLSGPSVPSSYLLIEGVRISD